MKKYELIDKQNDLGLYQIKALIDGISINVKIGDLGGWIESESNLSHDDDCWVSGKAAVSGDAKVLGNAWVSGNAKVLGNAMVYGNAMVFGNAEVYCNAHVSGNAHVLGNARVYGNAMVSGNARVYGNAEVLGNAMVLGKAEVSGTARVYDNAWVLGKAQVYDNARVSGTGVVNHNMNLSGDMDLTQPVLSINRSDGYTFFTCRNTIGISMISAGCRYFTYQAALDHWRNTRGGTPLGDETMKILEFLKNE